MNFQVSDLLHQQYHLLESDIFFILATKDLELQLFTFLFTVQQKEPFEAEKPQTTLLLYCLMLTCARLPSAIT